MADDHSFLKNEFQTVIKDANANRVEDNTLFINKLSTIQKGTTTLVGELTTRVKETFIFQDKVITSLKESQEAMYEKLTTISVQVANQM